MNKIPKYCTDDDPKDIPKPYAICTIGEWARRATRDTQRGFGLQRIEHRDIEKEGDDPERPWKKKEYRARIEWYNDEAFAIVREWWDQGKDAKTWVYRIGCDHEWEITTIGNCLHRHHCQKCGIKHEIDSGG